MNWRAVLVDHLFPLLTPEDLGNLKAALESDDPGLIQGATTSPPPLGCVQDWEVEGCCLVGYVGWKRGLATVGEVEEFFSRLCFRIDQSLGEPAGCRYLLNWFDEVPRGEMRGRVLREVLDELDRREAA